MFMASNPMRSAAGNNNNDHQEFITLDYCAATPILPDDTDFEESPKANQPGIRQNVQWHVPYFKGIKFKIKIEFDR